MLTPAPDVANNDIDALLTQFARELASKAGVSNADADVFAKSLRWYQNKAGAICILKRGKDRTLLATISPKKGDWTHLYPSWEAALTVLAEKKAAEGVSRMSHEGIAIGQVPLAESEKE